MTAAGPEYSGNLELALINARLYGRPAADRALLVRNGRIVLIGSVDEVRAAGGPATEVLDLAGASVLPGFTDSHTHFHRTAMLRKHFLDFEGMTTISGVLAAVAERAAGLPTGTWLQGDNLVAGTLVERRLPDRYELDAVAPDHPVLLRGMGKHVVVANSWALRLAGIDAATRDPDGGRIDRDGAGDPTGILHERGKLRLDTTRADTVVPALDDGQRLAALRAGIGELHRNGVTSIHEITRTPEEFGDYAQLHANGELGVRVVGYPRVLEGRAPLSALVDLGLRSGFGDDWLRLGGVKLSIDGACTFRNAAVYDAYPGQPANFGIIRATADEVDAVVLEADRHGLQVAVHAIGPRAVDMALDAFAGLPASSSANGNTGNGRGGQRGRLRHRIEHAYLPPSNGRLSDQFKRMRDLQLVLSTQPAFIHSVGDSWFDIFDEGQASAMVPLRSALDAGLTVLANSDCPSAPPAPLVGIQAAVNRRTSAGRPLDPAERITVVEAITMYTSAPAYAAGEEFSRGRLATGLLADLTVLAADPESVPAIDLAGIDVLATVVGGQLMHRHRSI
ncbi:MAG: Amidohydrolase 3 [Frankiales bacterium]|nr:Amidohydrolase 3 [Frankiales bacterium]